MGVEEFLLFGVGAKAIVARSFAGVASTVEAGSFS